MSHNRDQYLVNTRNIYSNFILLNHRNQGTGQDRMGRDKERQTGTRQDRLFSSLQDDAAPMGTEEGRRNVKRDRGAPESFTWFIRGSNHPD